MQAGLGGQLALSLWDVFTAAGAAQHHLSLATSTSPRWPNGGGQGAAATSLWVPQAALCSRAPQADNAWCCRGPSHLFPALAGIPGAAPNLAGSACTARDSERNLPGRSGVALLLCRLAMCFSLEGVAQEKPFPVFGSGWAAPARG